MIAVTQCPHCQTTFRVTDDQLKLYDGAVRCGVCQQVFNGKDHLLADKNPSRPASVPAAPEKKPAQEHTNRETLSASPSSTEQNKQTPGAPISLTDDAINAASAERAAIFDALEQELSTISLELGQVSGQLFATQLDDIIQSEESAAAVPLTTPSPSAREPAARPPTQAAPPKSASLSPHPDHSLPGKNAVYSTSAHLDDVAGVAPSTLVEAEVVEPEMLTRKKPPLSQSKPIHDPLMHRTDGYHADFLAIAEEDDEEPDFVRKGRKKKRGGFSGIFVALMTLLLLVALAVQCLYMFSDRIAIWWPPAQPAVVKACQLLSCPRRLETRISSLSIESSELQPVPSLTDKYALSLLIRNSGSAYQTWPHIELTLTDAEKKPVVRRVLAPLNYLQDADRVIKGIAPYSEESVKLYLEMKADANVDYRISLFYP